VSPLELDRRLLLTMRTRAHSTAAERALGFYSRLGEHAAGWLVLGTFGAVRSQDVERRRRWRRGLEVIAGAYGVNYAIKLAVRRPRPELPGLTQLTPTVSRLSFPSAHTTTSFAAARAYRGLVPTPILYGAAGLFAVSRPYLGVHYPSDVLAGALIGTAVAGVWP
jgi:membrane-associated phospholipid phosphatase